MKIKRRVRKWNKKRQRKNAPETIRKDIEHVLGQYRRNQEERNAAREEITRIDNELKGLAVSRDLYGDKKAKKRSEELESQLSEEKFKLKKADGAIKASRDRLLQLHRNFEESKVRVMRRNLKEHLELISGSTSEVQNGIYRSISKIDEILESLVELDYEIQSLGMPPKFRGWVERAVLSWVKEQFHVTHKRYFDSPSTSARGKNLVENMGEILESIEANPQYKKPVERIFNLEDWVNRTEQELERERVSA